MTEVTETKGQPIGLQQQIETLKQEIGKPRDTRGKKVRGAAIRFEETFRGRKAFSSEEFDNWLRNDPDMANYHSNPSTARIRLQAAGYRDDMPHPFEIIRVRKSEWRLRAVEEYILSTDISEEIKNFLEKKRIKLQHGLQACDLGALSTLQQYEIVSRYRNFLRNRDVLLTLSKDMDDDAAQLGWLTKPALENGE